MGTIDGMPVHDTCQACGSDKPPSTLLFCTECAFHIWTIGSDYSERRVLVECEALVVRDLKSAREVLPLETECRWLKVVTRKSVADRLCL